MVCILRIKNRFSRSYNPLAGGGYRDLQILLLLPDGGGSVEDARRNGTVLRPCELQVNLTSMVAIKNGEVVDEECSSGAAAAAAGCAAASEAVTSSDQAKTKRGHDAYNVARAIDAFSPRTLQYKGTPGPEVFKRIAIGALLEVDFERYDGWDADSRAALNTSLGSKQCRVTDLR